MDDSIDHDPGYDRCECGGRISTRGQCVRCGERECEDCGQCGTHDSACPTQAEEDEGDGDV